MVVRATCASYRRGVNWHWNRRPRGDRRVQFFRRLDAETRRYFSERRDSLIAAGITHGLVPAFLAGTNVARAVRLPSEHALLERV